MKFRIGVARTVTEYATIHVEAHSQEQAELIAQYIAVNGKDPWDRTRIDVEWESGEMHDVPEIAWCTEDEDVTPDNTKPKHTEGLWAPAERAYGRTS